MLFTFTQSQFARLQPAYLVIDKKRNIHAVGPAISRQMPEVLIGDPIELHFVGIGTQIEELLDPAVIGGPIELQSKSNHLHFGGNITKVNGLFLLSLHIAFADEGALPQLKLSDFAPGDPTIDTLLLLGMQKAMLDQATELTNVLSDERQKSEGLAARISTVASFLAHDFNNYLSIINLNCDRILNNGMISENDISALRVIREISEKSASISQSLLTLSANNTEEAKEISVDEMISHALPYLRSLVGPDINLELELAVPDALVEVDESALMNCLTNLFLNSCEAMRSGGEIKISTFRESNSCLGEQMELNRGPEQLSSFMHGLEPSSEMTNLVLMISDTGPGMSEEVLKRAFDPYFTTKQNGTGIGLASAKNFVEFYKGSIELQSSPGAGAQVILRLPIARERVEFVVVSENQLNERNVAVGQESIIVVDDEQYALEALVELLESEGYCVVGVTSPSEAMSLIEERHLRGEPFQLLLTDMVMPEASGLELSQSALKICPDLKVLFMSGLNYRLDEQKIDYPVLSKPLNIRYVMQAISHAMCQTS